MEQHANSRADTVADIRVAGWALAWSDPNMPTATMMPITAVSRNRFRRSLKGQGLGVSPALSAGR
jgi:hypothetical protein